MKVQDCINHLAVGELSNIGWLNLDSQTEFDTEDIKKIIALMNEALTRLYTKFILKTGALFVELQENKTEYILTKEHISNGYDCPDHLGMPDYNKYIRPMSGKPFEDDIIKILTVTLSSGINLPLNNSSNPVSVYTPSFNVLQVPLPFSHGVLAVTYQANHFKLNEKELNKEMELPESLYGALYAYVAYLAYSNINTQEAVQNSQKYFALYTDIINDNVLMDTVNQSNSQTNVKFQMNGWC